jgi:hypothetical protein
VTLLVSSPAILAENETRYPSGVGRGKTGCDSFVDIRNNWYLLGRQVLHRNRIARLSGHELLEAPLPNSGQCGERDLRRRARRRKAQGLEPCSALRMDTSSRPNPVA